MRYAVALVALLVTSAALGGVATAQESPEIDGPSRTTFDVHLTAEGDARWVVRVTYPLDTEEERAAFRDYGAAFEDGEARAGPGIQFFRTAADGASQVAGREMGIVNVTRAFSLGEANGTLRLGFRWTAFLDERNGNYVLRDALRTPDGTWLDALERNQTLRVHTPREYDVVRSIEARQENDSLVIAGPESFDAEEFVVVYEPATPPGSDPPILGLQPEWAATIGGLLALLLVVAGVVLWRFRRGDLGPDEDGVGTPGAAAGGSAGSGAAVSSGPDGGEPGDDGDGVDPALLSDEERVEQLVERNGGRMRQADIVSETEWSDAKVSQLLSRMAEEGSVEKLRLGRENVISLPDEEEP